MVQVTNLLPSFVLLMQVVSFMLMIQNDYTFSLYYEKSQWFDDTLIFLVPKTAPKISVNVISSTELNVTWKPLTRKEAQGIVTEYKLEWRLFRHPSVRVETLPVDVEEYVLSGKHKSFFSSWKCFHDENLYERYYFPIIDLIPGEQYDLRVLARTKQGWPNISDSQFGWLTVTMPSTSDFTQAQILILNSTTIKVNITGKHFPFIKVF